MPVQSSLKFLALSLSLFARQAIVFLQFADDLSRVPFTLLEVIAKELSSLLLYLSLDWYYAPASDCIS